MAHADGHDETPAADGMTLSYHLMHPGGDSEPGDPNAAFHLDGVCHLHYILRHQWRGQTSYSFVHVSSADMLHWSWHPTTLQPASSNWLTTAALAPWGRQLKT